MIKLIINKMGALQIFRNFVRENSEHNKVNGIDESKYTIIYIYSPNPYFTHYPPDAAGASEKIQNTRTYIRHRDKRGTTLHLCPH